VAVLRPFVLEVHAVTREYGLTRPRGLLALIVLAIVGATPLVGCVRRPAPPSWPNFGGDPTRGAILVGRYSCGACHEMPGVEGADGLVGPPLGTFSRRTMIAGVLPNTPENLVHWLRSPQAVVPGNAMPNVGLSDAQARDVAAYLYAER
jgi:cytochrome c